jgi:Uma2 family endonuclease
LIDGVIFMMAGAASQHNLVSGNVFAMLRTKLRGSGCRPYGSDQAVRTGAGTIRYPDVSVFCGKGALPEDARQLLLGNPTVVVEVLSPSTTQNDSHEKLPEYCALDTMKCVVLIAPDDERIRKVERGEDGGWTDRWLRADESLSVAALNIVIDRADIFARD